jgi:hypothetical protein
MPRFTQSEALKKSHNNTLTQLLLYKAHSYIYKILQGFNHSQIFLNLTCSSERILLECKKLINLFLLKFLQIFENAISNCSYARFIILFTEV